MSVAVLMINIHKSHTMILYNNDNDFIFSISTKVALHLEIIKKINVTTKTKQKD